MEALLAEFYDNDELTNVNCMVFSEDLIKMFDICLFLAQKIEEDRESAFKAINKFAKLTKDTKQKNSDLKAEIKRLEE